VRGEEDVALTASSRRARRDARHRAAIVVPLLAALCCGPPGDREAAVGNGGPADRAAVRLVVVTHGQSSDPFWSIVANGVHDAAREMGVRVEYQAPTHFDMVRMSDLIDAAVASRPDGLIVSIPDADALGRSIDAAVGAGIPTISINSGDDAWRALGLLAHIGQTEYEAGKGAGERLAEAGARRVLCVNHEVGNLALDLRCRGLADGLAGAGGAVQVLAVNLADPDDAQQRIAGGLAADPAVDGVFTLGPAGALAALPALRESGRIEGIRFATFDLVPEVLAAIRDGEMGFAIDQQPYLQGYLPVVLLTKYLETGTMAGGGQVIRTGPGYVTRDNAERVMALTERGIR
jgi:simple sugar transport system substrate-binding protein